MLPDRSVLIGQELVKNAKIQMRHFEEFLNTVAFSGRQPSYVILLHRNMEIEKVEHKVDDK